MMKSTTKDSEDVTMTDVPSGNDKEPEPPLSWVELVAQLLHDKQVVASLSGKGIQSYQLHRLVTEALEGAAKALPYQTDLMGDLLTPELQLPDEDPDEEEVEVEEQVYPPMLDDEQKKNINVVGRIFGPNGLILLALEAVSGVKIKVEGKVYENGKVKISNDDETMHLSLTTRDTPARARVRMDCVKRDIARLWTIPDAGEVDEVKMRQLRLAKMLSGKYDPDADALDLAEEEKREKAEFEAALNLPELRGEEHITLNATLAVPTEGEDVNWVGRILGPKGKTLQRLRLKTGCRLTLKGKGVEKSDSGPLQISVVAVDEPSRASIRLQKAIEETKKLLVIPDDPEDDPVKKEQDREMEEEKKKEERKLSLSRIPTLMNAAKKGFDGLMGSGPGGIGPIRSAFNKAHRFNPMAGPLMGPSMGFAGGSVEGHKVFVYQIGSHATELEIYGLFGHFGAIRQVNVPRGENKTSKGYAFVTFEDYDSAYRAVNAMDGYHYEKNGFKPLQVSFKTPSKKDSSASSSSTTSGTSSIPSLLAHDASPVSLMSESRMPLMPGYPPYQTGYGFEPAPGDYQLFIYNIGPDATEVDLYALCSPYGPISHVHVQKDPTTDKGKGFGFVTFSDYHAAISAIDSLNGHPYPKNSFKQLKVSFKTKKASK